MFKGELSGGMALFLLIIGNNELWSFFEVELLTIYIKEGIIKKENDCWSFEEVTIWLLML